MADDNLFQQYLRPPKSVLDYSAEYDQADARKQELQQNALQLAAGQQKYDDGIAARQRADQLRQTLMGLPQGATDEQRIGAMRGTGTPEGFAAADNLDKSLIDRAKSQADTAKTQLANQIGLHNFQAQKLAGVQTPEDALAWAQEGKALGLFSQPGQYERGVAAIQTAAQNQDPQAFAQWKAAAMQGGQSVTQQLEQQFKELQQKEQVRQFNATDQRIQSEGAANRANQIQVQKMIGDRQDRADAANQDDLMDPLAIRLTAQQYLAGDSGALNNFGRGAQGAKNLNAVRLEITKQANAAGLNGADVAAKIAEFGGIKAGQRTAGTRSANINIAANEAAELAPLALEASDKVVRNGFLPFGNAQVMFNSNVNNPEMRQFAMANTALVNAYGQVMSRGGVATDSDKAHARELLSTAFDQPSYLKAVEQLQKEIKAAQKAPDHVRKDLSNALTGRGNSENAAPSSASGTQEKPTLSDIFGK